jgi:hypothetical protein
MARGGRGAGGDRRVAAEHLELGLRAKVAVVAAAPVGWPVPAVGGWYLRKRFWVLVIYIFRRAQTSPSL